MKKLLAIILALAAVLCLAACGGEEAPAPDEPQQEISQPEQEETPTEPEEPVEEVDPKRGSVTDNVYKNEAFGISFTADENWYFMTDEEIASLMNISAEQMLADEYAEMIAEADIIYDMYANSLAGGGSVNVNYENLGLIYGSIFDEKAYLEISKTQLSTQLEGSEVGIEKCELSTVSVSGTEVPCLEIELDYFGFPVYEKLIAKKVGSWMGVVTLSADSAEAIDSLAAALSFE